MGDSVNVAAVLTATRTVARPGALPQARASGHRAIAEARPPVGHPKPRAEMANAMLPCQLTAEGRYVGPYSNLFYI
jgi:hypothetical protein